MGCYVNPPGMEKEVWLGLNGELTPIGPCEVTESHLPVCLVYNGFFTAAAVAYNQSERLEFLTPDRRPKVWYKVSRDKLRKVSDLSKYEERKP